RSQAPAAGVWPVRDRKGMFARPLLLSLGLLLTSGAVWAAPAGLVAPGREAHAEALLEDAEHRLTLHTFDSRRLGIAEMERACELAPLRVDIQLRLARVYADAGFVKLSRRRFEHALSLAPNDPDARLGLAQAWRRDWLKYLERRSLDRAIEHFTACARLDPQRVEAWLQLSALLVEKDDLPGARAAADRALECDHARADCQ